MQNVPIQRVRYNFKFAATEKGDREIYLKKLLKLFIYTGRFSLFQYN